MHVSSNCPTCRGLPVDGSLTDEEFFAFLGACREELVEKQASFRSRIAGAGRWAYEMDEGWIAFGGVRYPMTPVGSYSPEYGTWLWAWANEDFPPEAREGAGRIRGLFDVTGFRVFTDPGIDASPADAEDFVALAVHQLGAIAFFRVPLDGPVLYLAVHEPHLNT